MEKDLSFRLLSRTGQVVKEVSTHDLDASEGVTKHLLLDWETDFEVEA